MKTAYPIFFCQRRRSKVKKKIERQNRENSVDYDGIYNILPEFSNLEKTSGEYIKYRN